MSQSKILCVYLSRLLQLDDSSKAIRDIQECQRDVIRIPTRVTRYVDVDFAKALEDLTFEEGISMLTQGRWEVHSGSLAIICRICELIHVMKGQEQPLSAEDKRKLREIDQTLQRQGHSAVFASLY